MNMPPWEAEDHPIIQMRPRVRIPDQSERQYRSNLNKDSGHAEQAGGVDPLSR